MAALVRKTVYAILGLILSVSILAPMAPVQAEDDFSDTDYWINLCTSNGGVALSPSQKQSGTAFMRQMASQSKDLQKQIDELDIQKAEIAEKLAEYGAQVQNYQYQVNTMNAEIATYNG